MIDEDTADSWANNKGGSIVIVESTQEAGPPSMPDSNHRHMAFDYAYQDTDMHAHIRRCEDDIGRQTGMITKVWQPAQAVTQPGLVCAFGTD